jgi:hypothetical protein
MRRTNLLAGVVVLAGSLASGVVSCVIFNFDVTNCDDYPMPGCPGVSTPDGGHDGGHDGGPDCAGDPTTDPAVVTDACGVFVNASAAPGGDGKQASPFQTFAEAAAAKPARVFACGGTYTETMQVTFSDGVAIYGGFTGCTDKSWTWSASAHAQIATVADKPGVVLDGGANRLENVSVKAPGATMPGGSSIALLVNGGSLDMTNGALTALDAQDGGAGTSLMPDSSLDGAQGAAGADACSLGGTHPGAMGATNTCTATGGTSTAGNGGDGGDLMGDPAGSGANGSAMPTATAVGMADGKGGTGEGVNAAPLCTTGDPGAPGTAGNSGGGAAGPGGISAKGYQGAAGTAGGNGTPGQGGGGGGGAKGAMSVTCGSMTAAVPGASGGAGGTGGCGGNAGGGGQAGGSSIALLVLDADVTLSNVTLTAGKGGNGGGGGNGQDGGTPGSGGALGNGASLNPSCAGGSGGKGGNGGPGGGGQGGHSLGIAFQGTTAPKGGMFAIDMTKNGTGGAGGMNNMTANMGTGADGIANDCWDFGKKAACTP